MTATPAGATSPQKVRLHPAQKAFLDSDATFRAFCGGIGSGKTWAGAYDLIRRAKPGRLYLVIAPTYAMLSDATFRASWGWRRTWASSTRARSSARPRRRCGCGRGPKCCSAPATNPTACGGPTSAACGWTRRR